MSASLELFVQLLRDVERQKEEIQAGLQQAAALMVQSRQLAEDARRIRTEVLKAITQAEHTLSQVMNQC